VNPLIAKLGRAQPGTVLMLKAATWNALMDAIPNIQGVQGETAIQPAAIGNDLFVAFDNPVLFYVVINGELSAGFIPFNPHPGAAGLP